MQTAIARRIAPNRYWSYVLLAMSLVACHPYYKFDDFERVRKIDTHVHLNSNSTEIGKLAEQDNFRLVNVNVDVPDLSVYAQERYALLQNAAFPKDVFYVTSFSLQDRTEGWRDRALAHIDSSFQRGAIGLKVWKNIGMVYRDTANAFIMIDDPMFDPIVKLVIDRKKTLLGHLGEPRNCWLPLDQMTVNNDRSYFETHPEYHMFRHPEFPSYEDQINARDRFLEKHPDLRFVGAHLGSLEWSVDELAKRLDRFPNMAVDMAARIPHLQFQSQRNRNQVRNFIIEYADRLIYATDGGIDPTDDPDRSRRALHEAWLRDWRYFVTDEKMSTPEVNGEFTGLNLPREVVDKIYYHNAIRWFDLPLSD